MAAFGETLRDKEYLESAKREMTYWYREACSKRTKCVNLETENKRLKERLAKQDKIIEDAPHTKECSENFVAFNGGCFCWKSEIDK